MRYPATGSAGTMSFPSSLASSHSSLRGELWHTVIVSQCTDQEEKYSKGSQVGRREDEELIQEVRCWKLIKMFFTSKKLNIKLSFPSKTLSSTGSVLADAMGAGSVLTVALADDQVDDSV